MPRTVHIAISVDAAVTREMKRGPRSLQKRSMRRMRALTTARRWCKYDCLESLLKSSHNSWIRLALTSSPVLIPLGHDDDPVALHGHEVRHGGQLLDASQHAQHGKERIHAPPGEPQLHSIGAALTNSGSSDSTALQRRVHRPQHAAARGHGNALGDDACAHDGEAAAAVDARADGVGEEDGGGAAGEGVDGHGEEGARVEGGEEEHGAELEETRVGGREEV